jgi:hypothetical protein
MKRLLLILTSVVIFMGSTIIPIPVIADGGPMVDPLLFAKLKEGQQVAVIKLQDTSTATVDLFVSILDQTGESHAITYFVPLGTKPNGFQVNEEDSLAFAKLQTANLDSIIFQDYRQDREYIQYLFAGALLTNGVWLTPLWLPMLLSSCAEAPIAPISSFTTESSQVDVFNIDETTDLDSLINTTGLDASVKETLSRLQGQQIAVIKLNTSPRLTSSEPSGSSSTGEPGLHLSWGTSLTTNKNSMTYAYPLGTGAAWANPIEMTRVYIVAPADINFKVQYPKLGINRSGFIKNEGRYEPRITEYTDVSAYAVDEAFGLSGGQYLTLSGDYSNSVRIWRATYTNSNSAEDISITVNPKRSLAFGTFLRQKGTQVALIVGLIVAVLFWILAWYLLVPRLVGKNAPVRGLWRISLTYIAWNLLLFLPGGVLYLFVSNGVTLFPLIFMFILFGGASVLIFSIRHLDRLNKVSGKGFQIFAAVTGASGGAYLLFALGYAWLVRAI